MRFLTLFLLMASALQCLCIEKRYKEIPVETEIFNKRNVHEAIGFHGIRNDLRGFIKF